VPFNFIYVIVVVLFACAGTGQQSTVSQSDTWLVDCYVGMSMCICLHTLV